MRARILFWPLVVAVLALVAHALGGPPAEALPGGNDAVAQTVYGIIFGAGLVIATALWHLAHGGRRTARQATVWLALFAVIALAHAERAHLASAYERIRGSVQPSAALSTAQGEAELRRAWDGHYRAEAEVNGVRTQLMVDTGASMVLLPFEQAHRLGIPPDALDYSLPVTTANGTTTVAPVRLASVRIGPIAVYEVQAAVARPGRLKVGLLGMSFLDKLTETSFRGDRLILRQ